MLEMVPYILGFGMYKYLREMKQSQVLWISLWS